MSTFAYTAFDSKGKPFRGSIQEKSWTQALRRVREMGLFPTSVKEKPPARTIAQKSKGAASRAHASGRASRWPSLMSPVRLSLLTAFTRQIATLLEAGIPILRSLRSIEQQEENRALRLVLRELITEIEGGSMFSEALARHPKVFSPLYINMIVAGETAGMLESTLARLADFMERTRKIRGRIVSALFYPAAVMVVAIGILIVLMAFVIPRFREVLGDLTGSANLPVLTQYVFDSSQFIKNHLLHLLALAAVLIVGCKLTTASRAGRAVLDRLKLRLPVLGRVISKAAIARFARTLGTMLENGVPVLQALTIARETASNAILARAIQQTHDRVKDGDTLTAPLQHSGVFPATTISMIDVGEQSGALPRMLLKIADTYDEDVDNIIASALSLLEPLLIIFLAVVVGTIVIAMFLPLLGVIPNGFDGQGLE